MVAQAVAESSATSDHLDYEGIRADTIRHVARGRFTSRRRTVVQAMRVIVGPSFLPQEESAGLTLAIANLGKHLR